MALKINTYHGTYNRTKRSIGLASIKYFVVHYTGGTGSAKNNCIYFASGNRNASADFFIDKNGSIWEYNNVLDGYYTWHCGDGGGKYGITNTNSIGVEVVSNGEDFTEAQINALAALYAHMCSVLGHKLQVVRHYDASRKSCPAPYVNDSKWQSIKARIEGGQATAPAPAPKPSTPSKTVSQVADEVIAGKWGNGSDRVAKLKAAGYDADAVQAEVNRKLGAGTASKPAVSAPAKKSVSQIADEVIAGKWGNGSDRTSKLKAAGYDAAAVQAEVNRKLGATSSSASSSASTSVPAGRYTIQVNDLRIRESANGKIVPNVSYNKGDHVNLDGTSAVAGGIVWGRYTGSSSGKHRWIGVRSTDGKKVYAKKA